MNGIVAVFNCRRTLAIAITAVIGLIAVSSFAAEPASAQMTNR